MSSILSNSILISQLFDKNNDNSKNIKSKLIREHVSKNFYLNIFGSLEFDVSEILFDDTSFFCRRHYSLFHVFRKEMKLKNVSSTRNPATLKWTIDSATLAWFVWFFEKEASTREVLGM